DRGFVFHDQNRLARCNLCRVGCSLDEDLIRKLYRMMGQVQAHRAALADLRANLQLPTRLLGKAVDHREPKPGTSPNRLGRKEWVECTCHNFRTHAKTGVGNTDCQVFTGSKFSLQLTSFQMRV